MSDDAEPAAPDSALVWIPCPALACDVDTFSTGGFAFVRLGFDQWWQVERSWVRDMYADLYRARPRFFAVQQAVPDADRAFRDAERAFGRFVAAARLVRLGAWVDARRMALVHSVGGTVQRCVGPFRNRHYTAVFGEPLQLGAMRREVGGNEQVRPQQTLPPLAPAYVMTERIASLIPHWQERLEAVEGLPAALGLRVALRSFARGNDPFLGQPQRLLALLATMETVCGSFGRPGTPRGLGARLARVQALCGGEGADVERWAETDLRAVRNGMAHGSDHRRELDYGQVEHELGTLLRCGLRLAINWHLGLAVDGGEDPGLKAPDEASRTLGGLIEFLGRG